MGESHALMEIVATHSYRHAESILSKEYPQEQSEILAILRAARWCKKPTPKRRERKGKLVAVLDIRQDATNKKIEEAFRDAGWQIHPRIVSKADSQLAADYKKGVIQVEVQLGNMARWYTDVFKFLLSYAADDIEVGVLVVPMLAMAKRIDENIVNYERVIRELPHAKMAITIPIWIIGVA